MSPLQPFDSGSYSELITRPNPDHLTIQCVPPLVTILLSVEQKAGTPLSKVQVEAIRDQANVLAVPAEAAKAVDERRGYADLKLADAWEEWQSARQSLLS